MEQYEKKPQLNWRKVASSTGPTPKARHGHRVVNINQLMVSKSNLTYYCVS